MTTWPAVRGRSFDAAERWDLLQRVFISWRRKRAAEASSDAEGAARAESVVREYGERYRRAVPLVAVSRCPFTGAVLHRSLDPFQVDGLWWAAELDVRPLEPPAPTLFAFGGAMKLDGPLPPTPFTAIIGPEAPWVVRPILDHPAVTAVVSAVAVGPHIGFPITYFAQPVPSGLGRVDDWGRRFTRVAGPAGEAAVHYALASNRVDFDLGPWIERGKLAWIEPGDASLTLRSSRRGCPFVDLPGRRRFATVRAGRVTWSRSASSG